MVIEAKLADASTPNLAPRSSSTTPFSLRNLTPETPTATATPPPEHHTPATPGVQEVETSPGRVAEAAPRSFFLRLNPRIFTALDSDAVFFLRYTDSVLFPWFLWSWFCLRGERLVAAASFTKNMLSLTISLPGGHTTMGVANG